MVMSDYVSSNGGRRFSMDSRKKGRPMSDLKLLKAICEEWDEVSERLPAVEKETLRCLGLDNADKFCYRCHKLAQESYVLPRYKEDPSDQLTKPGRWKCLTCGDQWAALGFRKPWNHTQEEVFENLEKKVSADQVEVLRKIFSSVESNWNTKHFYEVEVYPSTNFTPCFILRWEVPKKNGSRFWESCITLYTFVSGSPLLGKLALCLHGNLQREGQPPKYIQQTLLSEPQSVKEASNLLQEFLDFAECYDPGERDV